MSAPETVLDVRGLTVRFRQDGRIIDAVKQVSFSVAKGETVALVGESGSGKSVTALSTVALLPDSAEVSGSITYLGQEMIGADAALLHKVRGNDISFVFQEPMTSLNPLHTIARQLGESLALHQGLTGAAARARIIDLLLKVGIREAESRLQAYPHQLSGGQRQRVMIAMALANGPELLIADEPTTALDVTIQAQIIELVRTLRTKLGMAIIWITHDLGVIAGIADRVLVMYGGQVVEQAPVRELFADPRHPYTRALLKTIPKVSGVREARLQVIEGQPPIMGAAPTACPFRARCGHAFERCARENPARRAVGFGAVGTGHDVACHWNPEPEVANA